MNIKRLGLFIVIVFGLLFTNFRYDDEINSLIHNSFWYPDGDSLKTVDSDWGIAVPFISIDGSIFTGTVDSANALPADTSAFSTNLTNLSGSDVQSILEKIDGLSLGGGASITAIDTVEGFANQTFKGDSVWVVAVPFGALPNNTSKSVAHGISDIDLVIRVEAVAKRPGIGFQIIPHVNEVSLSAQTYMTVDFTNVNMSTATDYSTYTITYVTMYYTKT